MFPKQYWFFLYEESSSPTFKQTSKMLCDVIVAGVSFQSILTFIGRPDADVRDFKFFMHGESMEQAVRLSTDKSIWATSCLYCGNDQVVTIIVRPAGDCSPNKRKAVSAYESLKERRRISGKSNLQAVAVTPIPRQKELKGLADVEIRFPIGELGQNEQVVLDLGQGDYDTCPSLYLYGWMMAEIENGKALDEIVVKTITAKGTPVDITFEQDTLLESPIKQELLEAQATYRENAARRADALDALYHDYPEFENNAKLFIQDLKRVGADARKRLQSTNHRFLLGYPYFPREAVQKILALPIRASTVQAHLNDLFEKAELAQEDICTYHDLAPIFLRAFDMEWDSIRNEKLTLEGPTTSQSKATLIRQSITGIMSQIFARLTAKEPRENRESANKEAMGSNEDSLALSAYQWYTFWGKWWRNSIE